MSVERTLLAGVAAVLTAAGSIAKIAGGPRVLLAKLGWDLPSSADDIGLAGLDMARVGTRQNKVSGWETETRIPCLDTRLKLARALDVPITALIPA